MIKGLIQKEKVCMDCEKGAQISILVNKTATQWWCNIIIKESIFHFLVIMFTLFFIFLLLCSHYVADLIKKLELHLVVVSALLMVKFWGHSS